MTFRGGVRPPLAWLAFDHTRGGDNRAAGNCCFAQRKRRRDAFLPTTALAAAPLTTANPPLYAYATTAPRAFISVRARCVNAALPRVAYSRGSAFYRRRGALLRRTSLTLARDIWQRTFAFVIMRARCRAAAPPAQPARLMAARQAMPRAALTARALRSNNVDVRRLMLRSALHAYTMTPAHARSDS